MADEHVSLYRQLIATRQQQYCAAVSSGKYTPILYPVDSLPALYLILGLAVSPRLPLKWALFVRYTAFVLIFLHGVYLVSYRRTLWFGGGYAIGLVSVFGTLNAAAFLLFNDAGRDFTRLETQAAKLKDEVTHENGSARAFTSSCLLRDVDTSRHRVPSADNSTETKHVSGAPPDRAAATPSRLIWQGYPHDSTWLHVLDWTVDLVTSIRGAGWKHRLSTMPPIDIPMVNELSRKESDGTTVARDKPTAEPLQSLRSLQVRALRDFIVGYCLLDFLKTTMVTDPYFLGIDSLESPTPWRWLARVNGAIPFATRLVRLSMSMTGVLVALLFIFSLNPLFFTAILPSLVDVSKITKAPLLEPCLYPPQWYPLSTSVCQSGLTGFWGKFWHQMFRYSFTEPSRVLIRRMGLDARGSAARVIQVFVAFNLSGLIHAAGSYTSFSLRQTHPFSGSLMFFLLQGLAILTMSSVVKILRQYIPDTQHLPSGVGKTVNVLVVVLYLYVTGPLLADEFAGSGIWLLEPVPVSPLRGLGFGPGGKDEGWWTWSQEGSRNMGWWTGNRWWERGLAIY